MPTSRRRYELVEARVTARCGSCGPRARSCRARCRIRCRGGAGSSARVASTSPAGSAWACSPPSPSWYPPTVAGLEAGGHPASAARYAQPWNIVLADDPDAAWPRISEHLAYAWDSYGRYMVEGTDQPAPPPVDPEQMRAVGSGMGDAGAFFMVLTPGAGGRLPARGGRTHPVGGDVLLDEHRGHARRPRGAPRRTAVHGPAPAGRRPRRVSQGVASSARERPVASSRSSWNCIQTVWYESQAGDANHSRLPVARSASAWPKRGS